MLSDKQVKFVTEQTKELLKKFVRREIEYNDLMEAFRKLVHTQLVANVNAAATNIMEDSQ